MTVLYFNYYFRQEVMFLLLFILCVRVFVRPFFRLSVKSFNTVTTQPEPNVSIM